MRLVEFWRGLFRVSSHENLIKTTGLMQLCCSCFDCRQVKKPVMSVVKLVSLDIPPVELQSGISDSRKCLSNTSCDISSSRDRKCLTTDGLNVSSSSEPDVIQHKGLSLIAIQNLLDAKFNKHNEELRKGIRQTLWEPP